MSATRPPSTKNFLPLITALTVYVTIAVLINQANPSFLDKEVKQLVFVECFS